MRKIIQITLCLLIANTLQALEESEVQKFFDSYQKLSRECSNDLIALYSDEAKITTLRHYPDGKNKEITLSGEQWKGLMVKALPMAKSAGDISEFSKISISMDGNSAKISANRYSVRKNYNDNSYFMIVTELDDGRILITEEHSETQSQTNELKKNDDKIQALLNFQIARIKGYLPLMVDQDTRLDSVKAEGNTLIYTYSLVGILKESLDTDSFTKTMKGILVGQSCSDSGLKQILIQGGSIGYDYKDKDGELISRIIVNLSDCN